MIKLVPDTELIRMLRRKLLLSLIRNIGLILLSVAAYRFYDVGLQQEWWPIVYISFGSSMVTASLCFSFFGSRRRE